MSDKQTWSVQQDEFIIKNHGKLTYPQMAEKLGLTRHQIRNRHQRLIADFLNFMAKKGATKSGEVLEVSEGSDGRVVNCVSKTIRTLEDALRVAKVNSKEWAVKEWTANKWDMGSKFGAKGKEKLAAMELWQVKVWLKPRVKLTSETTVDSLIARMNAHSPAYATIKRKPLDTRIDPCMLEVSIPDLHMGKYAWALETGNNYDIGIASRMFKDAMLNLLDDARGLSIEQILFPVGNDLLHTDNTQGTTTAGTPQDVDSRWQKVYTATMDLMVWAVDTLRHVAPVKVVVIPGNHDQMSSFCIGHAIQCWYRNDNEVHVDNSPPLRKYVSYGVNLIGLTHGDKGKDSNLPLLMAQETGPRWSDAKVKEWHVGHRHTRKEFRFTAGDTHVGVGVRVLPALTAVDAWHHEQGYVHSPRAAEAYVWGKARGYRGHFSATPNAQ